MSTFFLYAVFADDVVGNVDAEKSLIRFLPVVMVVVVIYFFMIRPQYKRVKEHAKLLDSVKKGDRVVVSGGIIGLVNRVDSLNSCFFIEISSGVEVKVLKSSVTEVISGVDEQVKAEVKK